MLPLIFFCSHTLSSLSHRRVKIKVGDFEPDLADESKMHRERSELISWSCTIDSFSVGKFVLDSPKKRKKKKYPADTVEAQRDPPRYDALIRLHARNVLLLLSHRDRLKKSPLFSLRSFNATSILQTFYRDTSYVCDSRVVNAISKVTSSTTNRFARLSFSGRSTKIDGATASLGRPPIMWRRGKIFTS